MERNREEAIRVRVITGTVGRAGSRPARLICKFDLNVEGYNKDGTPAVVLSDDLGPSRCVLAVQNDGNEY